MDFIICWEEIPERFRMYKYTTFDFDEIKKILLCHRKLICLDNYTAEEEEALNYLNCKLMGQDWEGNQVSKPMERFFDSSKEASEVWISGNYQFVATGFIM